jgi:hypothetical protein
MYPNCPIFFIEQLSTAPSATFFMFSLSIINTQANRTYLCNFQPTTYIAAQPTLLLLEIIKSIPNRITLSVSYTSNSRGITIFGSNPCCMIYLIDAPLLSLFSRSYGLPYLYLLYVPFRHLHSRIIILSVIYYLILIPSIGAR